MDLSPLRLGLTGGIGSGKSTVAGFFAQYGAAVIDADVISRSTTGPSGAAIGAIRQQFGSRFIDRSDSLDRDAMRALVFSDETARTRLEAIVHPLVGQEAGRQALAATQAGRTFIVFDIPLLVESAHWRQMVDKVLVVDCPPDQQNMRAVQRSGQSRETVQKIIATQASRSLRLSAADYVIYNGSISIQALSVEVQRLYFHFELSLGHRKI